MTLADSDNPMLRGGGLPTRFTQPEPSPLTRASDVQARAARKLAELRGELDDLAASLQGPGGQPKSMVAPTGEVIRAIVQRITQVNVTLQEMEEAAKNARAIIDQLRAERGQLQKLFVIAEHLNSTLDRPTLLNRMLDDLMALVRGDRAGIFLADLHQQPHIEAVSHRDHHIVPPNDGAVCRAAVEQAWNRQQLVIFPEVANDPTLAHDPTVLQQHIHSIMCAPFRTQQSMIGIMTVERRETPGGFNADDQDLLAAFCNLGTIAIESANLFANQQLQMQAVAAMKNYTDAILRSVASGVIALDNQGRVTRLNPAAAHILANEERAVMGKSYMLALETMGNHALIERVRQTIELPQVHETLYLETAITGRDRMATLNVSWSALQGPEAQRLGTVIVIDDLTELAAERETAQRIQRYVHPNVIDYVSLHPSAAMLGGTTREISVVFADLRDFTRLGESMTPAPLFALLNTYLNLLTEMVFDEGGTVTMFQGDAVMAIFNAPAEMADHQLRAVRTAWKMRNGLIAQQEKTGHRHVHFGIGVHVGPAYIGNIGHSRIQNYTAIGDAVNSAKRLQEQSRENRIFLSDAIYQRVESAVLVSQVDPVVLKGKAMPMAIWELRGMR